MKRKFIIAICLTLAGLFSYAQQGVEARIGEIRKAYAARIDQMNNQPYDDFKIEELTITYNRNYPGTGPYSHTDTFYWIDDENEDFMLKPQLYFATSRYTMCAGNYRHYREYLFDIDTGEPMFLLISAQLGDDSQTKKEYRFYFDNGKLIKQIPERIVFDENDLLTPDFGIDATGKAVDLISSFNSVRNTFHAIVPTYAW